MSAAVSIDTEICPAVSQLPREWDEFVAVRPEATIFHTRAWQEILAGSYGFDFRAIVAREGGQITGVLPLWLVRSALTGNRLIAAPFSYICPPLTSSAESEEIIIERATALRGETGSAYLEIKSLHPLHAEVAEEQTYRGFETYRLDLSPSEAQLLSATHKNMIQRGIAKAQKGGVEIRIGTGHSCVKDFHRLNLITCRKHGIPAQPLKFHQLVWDKLTQNQQAEFAFAFLGKRPLAAIVTFEFNGTVVYMYGASDERYLQLRPNHLLLWEAIKRAKTRGNRVFDLGRVSDDNPGLREFKQRWGAEATPLHYYYWPEIRGVGAVNRNSLKFKIATGMFRTLPIAVADRLTWLYKHLA